MSVGPCALSACSVPVVDSCGKLGKRGGKVVEAVGVSSPSDRVEAIPEVNPCRMSSAEAAGVIARGWRPSIGRGIESGSLGGLATRVAAVRRKSSWAEAATPNDSNSSRNASFSRCSWSQVDCFPLSCGCGVTGEVSRATFCSSSTM